MYYDYFGLRQAPFRITPDTTLFFPGGKRGEILDALVYAITAGEGIVKVVGEVGSGKTMLCRMLQQELPAMVEVVYLANPSLSPEDILHAIALELKLAVKPADTRLQVMHVLQEYLLDRHSAGRQVVVFVEEAQSMPLETLEEIRFLSNLETQQNKLLQIVLFGQPELDEKISRPEIRQLKERITYSFQLNPFHINDIRDYLYTRLRSCGYRSGEIFTDRALTAMARYSRGLVRRINILADKSMLAAYAGNEHQVSHRHVRQAARDSEFTVSGRRYWPLAVAGLMSLAVVVVLYWHLRDTGTGAVQIPEPVSIATVSKPEIQAGKAAGKPPPEELPAALNAREYEPDPKRVIGSNPAVIPPDAVSTEQDVQVAGPGFVPVHEPDSTARQRAGDARDILGLNQFFELQDRGEANLTPEELIILKNWFESLPDEVAVLYGPLPEKDACRLCWSIIYRPLMTVKDF